MEIRDFGSISLMKSEEKPKTCCGMEICECKSGKEVEAIWRCKTCNHSNFKSQISCFYCNKNTIPDFSISQGPDSAKAQMENVKPGVIRKESDKFIGNRPRIVQRPKGYKKQNVIFSQKNSKLNNSF